ncbi:uncharacterized protein Sbp2 [Anabrus simplex]|uniref:uncharacterized protein Sbp2 n=1 Tax=Anabrus simplex TaxID=316456 RepID=UPI0035A393C6
MAECQKNTGQRKSKKKGTSRCDRSVLDLSQVNNGVKKESRNDSVKTENTEYKPHAISPHSYKYVVNTSYTKNRSKREPKNAVPVNKGSTTHCGPSQPVRHRPGLLGDRPYSGLHQPVGQMTSAGDPYSGLHHRTRFRSMSDLLDDKSHAGPSQGMKHTPGLLSDKSRLGRTQPEKLTANFARYPLHDGPLQHKGHMSGLLSQAHFVGAACPNRQNRSDLSSKRNSSTKEPKSENGATGVPSEDSKPSLASFVPPLTKKNNKKETKVEVVLNTKGKRTKKSKCPAKKENLPSEALVEKQEPVSISSIPPVRGSQSAWQLILNLDEAIKACEVKRGTQTVSYASHFQQKTCWPKLGEQKKKNLLDVKAEETVHELSLQGNVECDGTTIEKEGCGEKAVKEQRDDMDFKSEPKEHCKIEEGTKVDSIALKEQLSVDKVDKIVAVPEEAEQCKVEEMTAVDDVAAKLALKERRKMKQAKKREEKRRKREEEFRKRLLAPKDQKVTLIEQNVIDRFLGRPHFRTQSVTPTDSVSEFPALGIKKRTVLAPKQLSMLEAPAEPLPLAASSKKPKRKDPITIDILQAIKTSELKQHQQQHDSVMEKKVEQQHYGGNPLDSDNPERKRGKCRENRPKKPTKLKALILAERVMKKNAIRTAILQKLSIVRTPNYSFLEEKLSGEHGAVVESGTADCKGTSEESSTPVHRTIELSETGVESGRTRLVIPEEEWQQLGIGSRKIHSRRFREYCDHSVTVELNTAVEALLRDIVKFHDAQYHRNPVKANARRRHVTGLKEVKKQLGLKKLKLVIIVPDLEKVQTKGGLDHKVEELKEMAAALHVPCVFALSRKLLGKVLYKEVPVSCVGIISYEGAENKLKVMLEALAAARLQYRRLTQQDESVAAHEAAPTPEPDIKSTEEEEVDVNKQVVSSLLAKLCEKESRASDLLLKAIANAPDSD